VQDAAAAMAEYNAVRIKQGGVPFVMMELQMEGPPSRLSMLTPYISLLTQNLSQLKIPYNFNDKQFDGQRLNDHEVELLLFGHRVHGRYPRTGHEHGLYVSADGKTGMQYGGRFKASGSARLDGNRLCFVEEVTEWCTQVLRNPGGTRARENEYFFFDGWAWPFSIVD
jgi:hypothetical protein